MRRREIAEGLWLGRWALVAMLGTMLLAWLITLVAPPPQVTDSVRIEQRAILAESPVAAETCATRGGEMRRNVWWGGQNGRLVTVCVWQEAR